MMKIFDVITNDVSSTDLKSCSMKRMYYAATHCFDEKTKEIYFSI